MKTLFMLVYFVGAAAAFAAHKTDKPPRTNLDDYIRQADERARAAGPVGDGSLYLVSGPLANMSRDSRAVQVDDIVTVVVADRASAISKGTVETARSSSANYGISAAAGPTRAAGPLSDLARMSGNQQLKGEGTTSRESTLSTTLSARITHVLPNGVMVVQGEKAVAVNSEVQVVRVRGLIRREDVNSANAVRSDRIAELEITVNGKGVVADSIRRPFILYRILLGILPF